MNMKTNFFSSTDINQGSGLEKEKFVYISHEIKQNEAKYERNFWRSLKRELKNNFLAKLALITLAVFVLVSIFAFLSPYDPNALDLQNKLAYPSLAHPFGTDDMGRDYLTRAMYGGRVSLMVGLFSMCVSITVGTVYGTISGFIGGKTDVFMMRLLDILMSIPSFLLIVVINTLFTPNIFTVILVIGMFNWMGVARIVRAQTLSLRERDFVLAAQALGVSKISIMIRHIVPNMANQIIVAASISIASSILTESSLSFLGYGVKVPMASWGSMLQRAQTFILERPLLAVYPGLFILLTVLSLNYLGDVLRKVLDPKLDQ